MPWLKAYNWEHEKFPWAYQISVLPNKRTQLAEKLSQKYGVRSKAFLSTKGGGVAHGYYIDLPKSNYDCALGLIVHEVVHVIIHETCPKVFGKRREGHGPKFKKMLVKVMVETKFELSKILQEINHV